MDHVKYLRRAGVPANLHEDALHSFAQSRKLSLKVLFTKLTAPIVMAFLVFFLKWEDEKLPTFFWRYDNEVSMNGDRGPVPLEDTPEARALCYYANGSHPRSRWARYVWLGWRNRGSAHAFSLGPVADMSKIRQWGDPQTNNGHEGVRVFEMNGYWQVFAIKHISFPGRDLCLRQNVGFKVGNSFLYGAARSMVVNIPFSLQGWDGPKP